MFEETHFLEACVFSRGDSEHPELSANPQTIKFYVQNRGSKYYNLFRSIENVFIKFLKVILLRNILRFKVSD